MQRALVVCLGVLSLTVFVSTPAAAQGAITGVVKDVSGSVLPGVTVEAASPVLIEKVRSVTTDASGQYRVVDLRPGAYSVTFTLPGFKSVRRDGIQLTGTFVATVSADLEPGGPPELRGRLRLGVEVRFRLTGGQKGERGRQGGREERKVAGHGCLPVWACRRARPLPQFITPRQELQSSSARTRSAYVSRRRIRRCVRPVTSTSAARQRLL